MQAGTFLELALPTSHSVVGDWPWNQVLPRQCWYIT